MRRLCLCFLPCPDICKRYCKIITTTCNRQGSNSAAFLKGEMIFPPASRKPVPCYETTQKPMLLSNCATTTTMIYLICRLFKNSTLALVPRPFRSNKNSTNDSRNTIRCQLRSTVVVNQILFFLSGNGSRSSNTALERSAPEHMIYDTFHFLFLLPVITIYRSCTTTATHPFFAVDKRQLKVFH